MISADYCKMMARYNRWQNRSLFGAADGLSEEARRLDRGAFFGSIHETLSHLAWGDTIWMSRFDGWDVPESGLADSPAWVTDWDALKAYRVEADEKIIDWAGRVTDAELSGDISWYSGATGRDFTKPKALTVLQLFNHQTHHRGQVHAMLTASEARPTDTDLPFMPDDA